MSCCVHIAHHHSTPPPPPLKLYSQEQLVTAHLCREQEGSYHTNVWMLLRRFEYISIVDSTKNSSARKRSSGVFPCLHCRASENREERRRRIRRSVGTTRLSDGRVLLKSEPFYIHIQYTENHLKGVRYPKGTNEMSRVH